jgi:hypothetical protein
MGWSAFNRARHFPVPISFDRGPNRLQGGAMNQSILTINGLDISLGTVTVAFAVAVLALLLTIVMIAARAVRQGAREAAGQMRHSDAMESRIAELARASRPRPSAASKRWEKAWAAARPSLPA